MENIPRPSHRAFAAFGYPRYSFLWGSTAGYYFSRWMDVALVTWLVLELTGSPFIVGLAGALRHSAMALGPFCGTFADRLDRRRILMGEQLLYAIAMLVIMGLFFTSMLQVWHLFFFIIIASIVHAIDLSTRFPVAGDIVENRHLLNATSVLLIAANSMAAFGPLLGGRLLDTIGAGGSFAIMAGSLALGIFLLSRLRIKTVTRTQVESVWKNVVDGFKFIRSDKPLMAILLIAAMANAFIFPYWYTLVPVFARDVLHTEATGYGLLMASIGLGALIGNVITASLPASVNKSRLLVIATFAWPGLLIMFALSHSYLIAALLLIVSGVFQGICMPLIYSLMMVWSPPEMWGRVTGVRAMAVATLPLGSLASGAGAGLWGTPLVLISNSCAGIIATLALVLWVPQLWKGR